MGLVSGPSLRFETCRGTIGEVRDGSGTLGEVRDTLEDVRRTLW